MSYAISYYDAFVAAGVAEALNVVAGGSTPGGSYSKSSRPAAYANRNFADLTVTIASNLQSEVANSQHAGALIIDTVTT